MMKASENWSDQAKLHTISQVCPQCQGTTVEQKEYYFRQMEHACSHCNGQGILLPNGETLPKKESTCVQLPDELELKSYKRDALSRGMRKLKGDVNKVEYMLSKYQKEVHELECKGRKPDDKEEKLKEFLLQKLRPHIHHLQEVAKKKGKKLNDYQTQHQLLLERHA